VVAGELVDSVRVENAVPDLGRRLEPVPLRGRGVRVGSPRNGEELVAQLLRKPLEAGHSRPSRPAKDCGKGGLAFQLCGDGGGDRLLGLWLFAGQQEEVEVAG